MSHSINKPPLPPTVLHNIFNRDCVREFAFYIGFSQVRDHFYLVQCNIYIEHILYSFHIVLNAVGLYFQLTKALKKNVSSCLAIHVIS